MSYSNLSPMYMMNLIGQVEQALWEAFPSSKYKNVEYYIEQWHTYSENSFGDRYDENFSIYRQNSGNIDLLETLHHIPNETLIRMATDLGVPTPGFLPVVPERFKNVLAEHNQKSYHNFERAIRNAYENPDESVALAGSALEGIIKTILEHEKLQELKQEASGKNLTAQAKLIARRLSEISGVHCPQEILTLCSQLRGLGKTVDDLRSDKATVHGKTDEEYMVDEPLWAALVVNICATIGLFLWELFNNKYKLAEEEAEEQKKLNESTFNIDEIPF